MKVLISGASGLIGSALIRRLQLSGDLVVRLVRKSPSPTDVEPTTRRSVAAAHMDELPWQLDAPLNPALLSDVDVVVHLAGRNLSGRWTPRRKREVRDSRLVGTCSISSAVAESFRAKGKPAVLVNASAVGYYGNRGDEMLSEVSACGTGFLAELCRDWEAAAMQAATTGVRVVLPRFGLVLSRDGGALAKMLPAFRLGLGGRLGSGRQFWSWITLEDTVSAIEFVIGNQQLSGPVNLTSANPVSNGEFTNMLARTLRRPAVFPVPEVALRLVFGGEMANEALLSSQRVHPAKLMASGFQWRSPELPAALQALLTK